ncbi:hypothetical protein DPMN_044412 [Dreissena polymorpha]|uniref:Uncharacterized protein n=1 Tax=Dreissena polymorpha TaxID=45954 RepID=A0A9D4D445_DREPO|nr:hypothetical protein DPMN_044412 [Dreissena polymorpha]
MDTVMQRRRTYLLMECMPKLGLLMHGYNSDCFHFGSQSEGTTTPGLQSDIDFLFCNNNGNIMREWEDWQGGMFNYLLFHDETTPPQQFLLLKVRPDTPELEVCLVDDVHVRKDSGQVMLSSKRWKQEIESIVKNTDEVTNSGPSMSWVTNWDIVHAVQIRKPLPEILHWRDRCRDKHWPPVQLLEAARIAPCFLVPAGNPDSVYKSEEWRLSPNLIERMLMFSFNIRQIKCYIGLKLNETIIVC